MLTNNKSSYLDSHKATSIKHVDWLNNFPHDDSGCRGNEVMVQGLGHEGERPGHPHIALNHLQLVVLETTNKKLSQQKHPSIPIQKNHIFVGC